MVWSRGPGYIGGNCCIHFGNNYLPMVLFYTVNLLLLKSRKPSNKKSVMYPTEVKATWVNFDWNCVMNGKVWRLYGKKPTRSDLNSKLIIIPAIQSVRPIAIGTTKLRNLRPSQNWKVHRASIVI